MGQHCAGLPHRALKVPGEGELAVFLPGEPGQIGPGQLGQGGGEPLLEPGVGLLQALHGQGDGVVLQLPPAQPLLQLLPPGLQGGRVPHGPLPAPGLVQLGGELLQPGLDRRQLPPGLLQSARRGLGRGVGEGLLPRPLGGQVVHPPPPLLQPVTGGGQLVLPVQGPGQGGGHPEQVPHLGGEGVHEVHQVGPAVLPPGLPVAEGPPDGFQGLGGPVGLLTAPGIGPGQLGQLLRVGDPPPGQDGLPLADQAALLAQGQGGQQGESQIEAYAPRPQGGQLGKDAGGHRRAPQQQAGDLERQEVASLPGRPGGGFRAGPAVVLRPLQGLRAGQPLEPLVLGRPLGLGVGLLRLPESGFPRPDLLVQHLEILQFPLGPAQGLPVGEGAVPLLRLQGGQGLPGGLAVGPGRRVPLLQSPPGQQPMGRLPGGQLVPAALQPGPLPLQIGEPGGHFLQLGQRVPHLGQLPLQPGDLPHAAVDPAAVEPVLQSALDLGEGDLLLPGGGQGGDTPLQLGGGGDRELVSAQEGGAGKHLGPRSGEQLPAGLAGEAGDGLLGAGVHRREGAKGGVPPGPPADGDRPALPLQLQLPLHGGARPGLIAVFVGQMALLVPVPGVDAVEHGPPEGAPGGFAPLVGGVDHGEAGPRLQPGVVQFAEGGGHGLDLHSRFPSSRSSRAARPYRAASWSFGSSGSCSHRAHISRRNRPVRESSSRRVHRSRGSRVWSRRVRP